MTTTILFILALILINVFFFLPIYLMNYRNHKNILPPFKLLLGEHTSLRYRFRMIYARESSDPFRIHFEFTFLLLLFSIIGPSNTAYYIVALIGGIGWILLLYSYLMVYIFDRSPMIKSDRQLAKTGLSIAHRYRPLVYLGIFLFILCALGVNFFFTKFLLENFSPSSFFVYSMLILCLALTFYHYDVANYHSLHQRAFVTSFGHFMKNVLASKQYEYLTKKEKEFFISKNRYADIHLNEKPNVKIVCLESYGAIIYKDRVIRSFLRDTFDEFRQVLSQKELKVVTGLSTSPIFSGGSWVSYYSFLYGLNFKDNNFSNMIFKGVPHFRKYESLLHFFKREGYQNYLICPLQAFTSEIIDWEMLESSFQTNKFLDWNKIGYQGEPISFYFTRSCPPDQYSINKAQALIEEENSGPNTSFFCTLNSHYPYKTPINIEKDWRNLNKQHALTKMDTKNKSIRYQWAIKYQLEVIVDFLRNKDPKNTIYIFFGDHQPPMIADPHMGLETPVHIISNNEKLLEPFLEKGFRSGFYPSPTLEPNIRHEGFFSLFMEGLNSAYGVEPELKLPYLPNGNSLMDHG